MFLPARLVVSGSGPVGLLVLGHNTSLLDNQKRFLYPTIISRPKKLCVSFIFL